MRHGAPLAVLVVGALLTALAASPASADAPKRVLEHAQVALVSGQPALAESLADAALGSLERQRHPDSLALARAWSVAARARIERGVPIDSTTATRAAFAAGVMRRRVATPAAEVAEAMETAGLAASRRSALPSASAWLRLSVASRRGLGIDPDTALAGTLRRLGRVDASRGQRDSARVAWEEALAIRVRADSTSWPEIVGLRVDLAELAINRKDFDGARRHLDLAMPMAERCYGDRSPYLIPVLQQRSRLDTEQDQVPQTIPLMERAYAIARGAWGDDDDRTLLLQASLASRYLSVGDPQRGKEELTDVERRLAAKPHPDTLKLAGVRFALAGQYFVLGDTLGGLPYLEKAVAGYEAVGRLRDMQYLYALATVARIYHSTGHAASAESLILRAIALDRGRPESPTALTGTLYGVWFNMLSDRLAWAEVERQTDSLIVRFDRAGLGVSVAMTHALRWKVLSEQALGRPEAARRAVLSYSRVERQITLRNVRAQPDRAALGFERQRSDAINWALELVDPRDPRSILDTWTELVRWRGMVRHELGVRHVGPAAVSDTALAATRARWVDAQSELARVEVAGGPAGATESARRRAEDMRREYVQATYRHLQTLPDDSLTIERIAGTLGGEQALVAFYEIGAGTDSARVAAFLWRAGAAGPECVRIGDSAPLAGARDAWDAVLSAPGETKGLPGPRTEQQTRAAGERVRRLIWEPLAAALSGAREVFAVPAGPVQDLHWNALPWGAHEYWAERGPVVRVLNAERELTEPALKPATGGVLAFGGIDYDRQRGSDAPVAAPALVAARLRRTMPRCRDAAPPRFDALPATRREVTEIAASWSERGAAAGEPRVVTGENATEQTFKRLAHDYRALHLATHGFVPHDTCGNERPGGRGIGSVSPGAPAAATRTGPAPAPPAPAPAPIGPSHADSASIVWIAFAGANHAFEREDTADDGLLTPEEVVTLDLSGTGWVVLSACYSTAGREEWAREGLSGMRRAFHMAGARTVIGSTWPVADVATEEWMKALYAARATGASSPGSAIRQACAAVLAARRRSGRSTHPFYWGGFTSTGE